MNHCSGNTLLNWDQYISGAVWAYHNTPHSSTVQVKTIILLFGLIVILQLSHQLKPSPLCRATDVGDYWVLSLSTSRSLAIKANKEAQQRYKFWYDKTAKTSSWVLVYFPQDETGKNRKLSQPWHMSYPIISRDVTVTKIYFPDDSWFKLS